MGKWRFRPKLVLPWCHAVHPVIHASWSTGKKRLPCEDMGKQPVQRAGGRTTTGEQEGVEWRGKTCEVRWPGKQKPDQPGFYSSWSRGVNYSAHMGRMPREHGIHATNQALVEKPGMKMQGLSKSQRVCCWDIRGAVAPSELGCCVRIAPGAWLLQVSPRCAVTPPLPSHHMPNGCTVSYSCHRLWTN